MHSDNLFITSNSNDNYMRFEKYIRNKYKVITINTKNVVGYICMTFKGLGFRF